MTSPLVLSNGARVVLAPFSGTEAAAILVLFKIGSRNEDDAVWGGSHFIEHLMFKGTQRRPRTVDISQELDRYGAQYNAYTGKDLTGYWVKIAAQKLPVAIDLLHDMLFHSVFDAQEMDREKNVIIEEIKMYEENPIMHIEDLLEEAMYEGHVLGKNIAGTSESMKSMKREDVLAYKNRYYRPDNMVIVASGNLPENITELLEKTFGGVLASEGEIPQDVPLSGQDSVGRVRFQKKDLEQVQLALGFPTVGRGHADEAPLKLLALILGGTMSSRLFVEVRERRGLCYTVRASTDAYQDTGMLTIRAGLDATRLEEAVRVIREQVSLIVSEGVTDAELSMAKDNIRGSMSLALEDSSDRAEFYARQLLFLGTCQDPQERLARYDGVTREDIVRVAQAYLRNETCSLAAIGPVDEAMLATLRG